MSLAGLLPCRGSAPPLYRGPREICPRDRSSQPEESAAGWGYSPPGPRRARLARPSGAVRLFVCLSDCRWVSGRLPRPRSGRGKRRGFELAAGEAGGKVRPGGGGGTRRGEARRDGGALRAAAQGSEEGGPGAPESAVTSAYNPLSPWRKCLPELPEICGSAIPGIYLDKRTQQVCTSPATCGMGDGRTPG